MQPLDLPRAEGRTASHRRHQRLEVFVAAHGRAVEETLEPLERVDFPEAEDPRVVRLAGHLLQGELGRQGRDTLTGSVPETFRVDHRVTDHNEHGQTASIMNGIVPSPNRPPSCIAGFYLSI